MKRVLFILLLLSGTTVSFTQDWRALFQESQSALQNEDYDLALEKAEACLSGYLNEDGELSTNYAEILNSLVTIHYYLENVEKSIEYGEKELQIRSSIGEEGGDRLANTHFNLGLSYQLKGDYPKSIESFKSALEINAELLGEGDYERLRLEWKIAGSYYYSGDLEQAKAYFSKAFGNLATEEVDNDYLIASYDYSSLLVDQGDYQNAGPFVENLVAIYEANGLTDQEIYAQSLKILSTSKIAASASDSEESLDKTIDVLNEIYSGDPSKLSSQLNQWAVLLRDMGKEELSNKVLAGIETSGDSGAMSLNNLAVLAFNDGKYSEAADYYVQALQSLDKSNPADQSNYAMIAENLVLLLESIGDLSKALEYQREAANLYRQSSASSAVIAKSESNLARVLKENGKNSESIKYYKSALASMNEDSADKAETLNGLASLYQQIGNYSEAGSTYELAFAMLSETDGKARAAVLNNMGSYYKEMRQFLLSRNYFDRALVEVEKAFGKESVAYANTQQNLALLNLELGSYQEAEKAITEAMNVLEKSFGKGHRNYTSALLNYGRIVLAQGNYRDAEPAFRNAMDIRSREYNNEGPLYAESLNSMAFFYQTLGNFVEAEPLLEEALKLFGNSGGKNTTNYATSLENLATLYQLKGEYEEAKPLLEEALLIDKTLLGEDHPLYSTTLHNLASLYKETDDLVNAEKLFNQALEIDRKVYGEKHPSYARTLYNLAALKQDQEKYEEAEKLFEEVTTIRREILGENHPDYAYALYGMASIKRVLEKPDAIDYYRQAIEKYLFQINEYFPALSEKEKSAFYEKISPIFESFKDFAIEEGLKGNKEVLEMLYDLQLSTKALLLNSSSKIRQRIQSSGDPALIKAFEDWLTLKEQLVKYYSLTLEELESENIDLISLSGRANDLEKEISEKSELFSREVDKSSINWKTLKSAMTEGEAAIEIFRIKKTFNTDSIFYAALIIEPDYLSPEFVIFKYGNQLESRMFNYYRNTIKFTVGDEISFENYWDPIEAKLSDVKTVYVSPDGIFNKISFPTLWDFANDTYVLDEYDIRLVSNSREVAEEHPTDNMTLQNTAEVFGNPDFGNAQNAEPSKTRASDYGFSRGVPPLPGTKVEIESLSGSLAANGWESKEYINQNASEKNFKNIESPRLLHVATHGFFMSDLKVEEDSKAFGIHLQNEKANPLFRSGLLFSGSNSTLFGQNVNNEEDGILTAYEAMNLNLDQTELVVMSACETGLGAIKNGEGVYGLQRAFLVAGAKSVVMSLWKVNDETTQMLMNTFYNYWLGGEDKLVAFKKAQLDLKKQYPDPYHWGAFVILGN